MTTKTTYWTYTPYYRGSRDMADPRIAIAKQIAWIKPASDDTEFHTPEPDNFNRAVFTLVPVECNFITDQVIYWDKIHKGWMTVFYVPPEQQAEYDNWLTVIKPSAFWIHTNAAKTRPRRKFLWTRKNNSLNEMTANERLFTMGYFEDFQRKYLSDDSTIVSSRLGEARASLNDLVPDEPDQLL